MMTHILEDRVNFELGIKKSLQKTEIKFPLPEIYQWKGIKEKFPLPHFFKGNLIKSGRLNQGVRVVDFDL